MAIGKVLVTSLSCNHEGLEIVNVLIQTLRRFCLIDEFGSKASAHHDIQSMMTFSLSDDNIFFSHDSLIDCTCGQERKLSTVLGADIGCPKSSKRLSTKAPCARRLAMQS